MAGELLFSLAEPSPVGDDMLVLKCLSLLLVPMSAFGSGCHKEERHCLTSGCEQTSHLVERPDPVLFSSLDSQLGCGDGHRAVN